MSSMGMDKLGEQVIADSVWVKVVSFAVRSGFGSTNIVNDTLVMDINGTGDIEWRGEFSSSLGTQNFRVVQNGTTVLGTVAAESVGTVPGASVAVGDTLELQAFRDGFGDTVIPGGSFTYLEFNQLTQEQFIASHRDIDVSIATQMSVEKPFAVDPITVNWNITTDMHVAVDYTIASTRRIDWNITTDILLVKQVVTPPSVFSFVDVAVSVHTVDGIPIGDFPCTVVSAYSWSREDTEVSTCNLTILTQGAPELVEELRQWLHWVTVWFDDTAVWTGPIQGIRITRERTTISARDVSTFMWRTRTPITKTWVDTAPQRIAEGVWQSMLELHGVRAAPTVLPGVADNTFTVSAVADQRMLHQFMDELTKVGLHWTVVAGRPVLGQFPRDPVAELNECDFLVELERRRNGIDTYNDIRVQGQNWAATAIAPLEGLRLQTIVSLDDMFGSANIQRAAQQYAQNSVRLRDELLVPPNASLHPQAPVTLDDLVPGKVFIVHSETVSQLMRLDQVTVAGSPGVFDVQVNLVVLESTNSVTVVGG